MTATDAAQAVGLEQLARDPLCLARPFGGVRVEEDARAVAGDDHLPAQPLARLVVEVVRAQALAEL